MVLASLYLGNTDYEVALVDDVQVQHPVAVAWGRSGREDGPGVLAADCQPHTELRYMVGC